MSSTDWKARQAEVANADGDDWDRLSEKLTEDWQAEYRKAFVEIAIERGWEKENAESWPDQLEDEAVISASEHGYCPRKAAEADVIACEEPL
jgi:hypothetical protein